MSAVIEGVGLVKRFGEGDAQVTAVNGVDIAVQSGELAMLKGDSGCGKTTLMSMLGCILRPSEGTTLLEGAEVDYSDERVLPRLRREKIGFVFQMFNLAPYLSALENVLLALDVAGKKGAEAENRAEELLRQVGLEHRLTHRPGQLSGGEKQRGLFRARVGEQPEGDLRGRADRQSRQPPIRQPAGAGCGAARAVWSRCRHRDAPDGA